jgi:hypothetical protein
MMSPGDSPPGVDPPQNKQKAATQRSSTRASRAMSSTPETSTISTRLSKAEIIKNSQSSIKSADSAKKWLYDHEYIIQGEELSTPTLTMALLYLANGRVNTNL